MQTEQVFPATLNPEWEKRLAELSGPIEPKLPGMLMRPREDDPKETTITFTNPFYAPGTGAEERLEMEVILEERRLSKTSTDQLNSAWCDLKQTMRHSSTDQAFHRHSVDALEGAFQDMTAHINRRFSMAYPTEHLHGPGAILQPRSLLYLHNHHHHHPQQLPPLPSHQLPPPPHLQLPSPQDEEENNNGNSGSHVLSSAALAEKVPRNFTFYIEDPSGRDTLRTGALHKQQVHTTPHLYCCPWTGCSKVFNRFYNLRSHYRIHSGEKPFVCNYCDAAFARNHDLKRHERIHSNSKPFSCIVCNKAFSRNDALNRHVRLNSCSRPATD